MTKIYYYKGYTFYATDITTDVRRPIGCSHWATYIANLYEIEDVKEAGKRPFLTSVNKVKNYINRYLV